LGTDVINTARMLTTFGKEFVAFVWRWERRI